MMKQTRNWLLLTAAILFHAAIAGAQVDLSIFQGMKARSIGPAGMSGRIAAIEAVAENPDIIYVGAATGGVWKTVNGGTTWEPIFDDQPVLGIGAIAVFQKNPDIVWVGTGEGNPRNSAGVGYGIYKSMDGGHTWQFLGLSKTERIHRILLHPDNPDIAYVAAMGTAWGENPERGVYKTTDGGKSWEKVLYVDEKTGCADLVMDPVNPNKLFAAMWQYRRWPWFFRSGGPGSGLFVTYDGGVSWKRLSEKDGLPSGELGRIGLAIARSNPNIVYALVEATKSALCRSEDGGISWKIVNQSNNINPRPFYFCDIFVDPENENRLYSLHTNISVSNDGGKSFETIRSNIHSDHHALWIHPQDGSFLLDGTDGGVNVSLDRGKTWRFIENIPVGQFYHINIDMAVPYHIYGGMQDNGSWRGPSSTWENGGIRNFHWIEVGFGDGFATLVDPSDPNYGYCMSQGGNLMRYNLLTGERKDIRPPSPADTIELRFNWNAAIAIDPFDPKTIYYGSQFVHKSTDRGETWSVISPDLTTNDPEKQKQKESGGLTLDVTNAENHTTILTIAPSPVQQGVIWVGTDDGNVQVTRDGGKTWTNVVKNIKGLPANTWCPHIEPSKFDAATAYVVFDDHRRANWKTYIYKTEDFGKSWKNLAKNDPVAAEQKPNAVWGFAHVIEQDPVKKELLYLGTEFGLYISFDDGEHWLKWTHGIPSVPVRALIVHPREHDLVIGTHGRAAYVLDNIRPLREISSALLQKPLHLFEIPQTYVHQIKQMDGYHFPADAYFSGENKPYGAEITFYVNRSIIEGLKKKSGQEKPLQMNGQKGRPDEPKVKIEIADDQGNVIRKMEPSVSAGINRIYWDLKRDGFRYPSAFRQFRRYLPPGPEVIPGTYTVTIIAGDQKASQTVTVLPDPRENIPLADRKAKYEMMLEVGKRIEVVSTVVDRMNEANKSIDAVVEKLKATKSDTAKAVQKQAMMLKKKMKELTELFVSIPGEGRQGMRFGDNISMKLGMLTRSLGSSYDRPTQAQKLALERADKELRQGLEKVNQFFEKDFAGFRSKVASLNLKWLPDFEKISFDE